MAREHDGDRHPEHDQELSGTAGHGAIAVHLPESEQGDDRP
jgi:hypothetical protein